MTRPVVALAVVLTVAVVTPFVLALVHAFGEVSW